MRLLALLLGAALLAGCGAEFVDEPPREPRIQVVDPPSVVDPTAISIPKIGAQSSLIPLGLTETNELDVPPVSEPGQASWYAGRDPAFDGDEWQPGENGPAIIAGHVDGTGPDGRKGYPGVFARLTELAPGDQIVIERSPKAPLTFVVTGVEQVKKAAFPWDRVMAGTDTPTLRLITCSGPFQRSTGHYVENTIVWAELG